MLPRRKRKVNQVSRMKNPKRIFQERRRINLRNLSLKSMMR